MLDTSVIPLYYLSSLAGLVMVAGGIWLLYKEKIYIDSESKQVMEIELPIGKFKSNLPALVLFALGFIPLIYPMSQCSEMRSQLHLKGSVGGDAFPVQVYAVIRTELLNQPGDFTLAVPKLEDLDQGYKVLIVDGARGLREGQHDVALGKKGELHIRPVTVWRYTPDASVSKPDPPSSSR